ncbi:frizzled-4 [Dendroctonus ponderosae]|uniref:frizzled-4 n=1 Tax=Dendroctonus ponderosae TaxID=77166 RepID=UPI00203508DA|nr:frizzled-4 [Dendroctonus ponderosae]
MPSCNMFFVYSFLFFCLVLTENTSGEPLRTCEPIGVELCMGLGYNMTGMPNLGGNDAQQDADYSLKSFTPLIQYGCSQQLKLFLCSVYVPMCTEKVPNPIGPCRGLCESVRSRCYPVLQGFGFPWPDALNCSRFPVANNHEHMCMEGPKENVDVRAPVEPAVRKLECSPHSIKNGVPGCAPPNCRGTRMFNDAEKKIAEVWISVWALACIASSLASLITLTLGGGRVCAPPLVGLSLSYLLVGSGWAFRAFTGPTGSTCWTPDSAVLRPADGLPNLVCAFVFLLLYYFGMAANVWWVCLCAWWLARSSTSWSPERLRGLTSALHVCAWGFPALQTVIALVYRDVDSDELTGTCYIGNKNLFTLWYLALVPHFLYFCAGGLLLTIGWIFVLKAPKLPRNSLSTPLTQGQPRTERDFLGALATLYVVPIFVVMMSYFIEYSDREKWLSGDQKPSMWFFLLLRHFMSLFMGISSVLWIWCEKSAQVWKSALKRLGPRFKPNKNTIALKYSVPHHSGVISMQGSAYSGSRQSSHPHSSRKSSRSHHLRNGNETVI